MPGFGTLRRHRVGSFRHLVKLQQRVKTGDDDRGHAEYTWEDVIADLPVAIKTLSGTEVETARQLYAAATLRVEAHADSRVTPQMRFLHGTREIYIGAIEDVQEVGRFMSLLCSELVE